MSDVFHLVALLLSAEIAVAILDSSHAARASGADAEWTAVALAPDGTWGAATEESSHAALKKALENCRAKLGKEIGCGAQTVHSKGGWIVGQKCGDAIIVVSGDTLAEAEKYAINEEIGLRLIYIRDLPGCQRFLTINPAGVIATPRLQSRE